MSLSASTSFESSRSNKKRTDRQPCSKDPCTQPKVEEYMSRIMNIMIEETLMQEVFEYHEVLEIIHSCLTIFADEPTLLQFPVPENGLVVIGDLHGDEYCLMKAFEFYGFPPDTSYLFLGDFVDRGPKQNEVLLFLLLMKLRWPEYVYILRGNHELITQNRADFRQMCLEDYGNPYVFLELNQMFDYIPLGAIVSDYFLLCHGGISQWMTCRANIMNIKRPTDLDSMSILEGALVADMLWSDPKPKQEEPFRPSHRHTSYCFNQEALHKVLQALNVQKLIRGHQKNEYGVMDNFGDGKCITVHTAIREESGHTNSGTIKIIRDANGEYVIEKRVVQIEDTADDVPLWQEVCRLLYKNLKRNTLHRVTPKCQWCEKMLPKDISTRVRCTGQRQATEWILEYANFYAHRDRIFQKARKKKDKVAMWNRGYKLFPVIYDCTVLNGGFGRRTDPCTFRILLSEEEQDFMRRYCPGALNFGISETLANDVGPRMAYTKRKRGRLSRISRRISKALRRALGIPYWI